MVFKEGGDFAFGAKQQEMELISYFWAVLNQQIYQQGGCFRDKHHEQTAHAAKCYRNIFKEKSIISDEVDVAKPV